MKDKVLTGASVVIFEKDCVILFRERQNGLYTEPGGKYEYKHSNIEQAANDELYEETCCLFNSESPVYHSNKKNYFDLIYSNDKKSRVYLMKVPYLKHLKDDYFNNLNILIKGNAKKHFIETNDVTRVYINDMRDAVLNANYISDVHVKDVYGEKIKLKKRTASIFCILFNEMDILSGLKIKKITNMKTYKDHHGLINYVF